MPPFLHSKKYGHSIAVLNTMRGQLPSDVKGEGIIRQ